MTTFRRIGTALLGALAVVTAIVVFRTATYQPPGTADLPQVALAKAVPVDAAHAAQHLAEAVRMRTVSHQSRDENDWAEWVRFHAWLQAVYPAAHAVMTREVVAEHTLVYTWPGAEPGLPAVLLLAHHDVKIGRAHV